MTGREWEGLLAAGLIHCSSWLSKLVRVREWKEGGWEGGWMGWRVGGRMDGLEGGRE